MCPKPGAQQPTRPNLLGCLHNQCKCDYLVRMPNNIPQWTLADRMAKSLRSSGLTAAEIATQFGVHRNSVSGWINGRINPDTRTIRLWAVTTGVPYEWLVTGEGAVA